MDFLESHYLYLYLLIFSAAYPLAQSFEWRLKYYRQWPRLIPATGLMMLLFIPWDVLFTMRGVWWFNERYITGFKIFALPIEEWLFFVIVPFACVFIYEVLNFFVKKDFLGRFARPFFLQFGMLLVVLSLIFRQQSYTATTFLLTGFALLMAWYFNPIWKGRFLLTYLVCWIPFLLVNGALTGSFTSEAVVNYNPDEFMGLRIFTIPVEDSIYNMLMLLMVISVYEKRKKIN